MSNVIDARPFFKARRDAHATRVATVLSLAGQHIALPPLHDASQDAQHTVNTPWAHSLNLWPEGTP